MSDSTSQTVTAANYNITGDTVHNYTTPSGQRFIGFPSWCVVQSWTPYNIAWLNVNYGPADCTLPSAITLSGLSNGWCKLIPSDPATNQTFIAKDNMGGFCGTLQFAVTVTSPIGS